MSLPLEQARRMSYQAIEPKISKLQTAVLKGIQNFFQQFNYYPRYRELAIFIEMDRITVSSRLVELRKKGYVMSYSGTSKNVGTKQMLTNKGSMKLEELGL